MSEMSDLLRAQDDLYEMLGMTVNDRRLQRSRSVIGIQGEAGQVASPSYSFYDPSLLAPPNTGRRASLPSSAFQPDSFDSMAADLGILLTSHRPGWF